MTDKVTSARKPLFNLPTPKRPAKKSEVIHTTPVKAPKPKTPLPPVKTHTPVVKKTAPKFVDKKDPKAIKYWSGGDKTNHYAIELVVEPKGFSLKEHISNAVNPLARNTSTSYYPRATKEEAVKKFNDHVKLVTTAKGLNVKKSKVELKAQNTTELDCYRKSLEDYEADAINETNPVELEKLNVKIDEIKQKIAEQEADQMNVEAKLGVFAKKKVVKKKRSSKQILNNLKSGANKLLKMEQRLKEKKANIDKELEKLKGLKLKHKERIQKHLIKVKDREARKAGAISPPTKFPKEDLSVALIKNSKNIKK